MDQVLILLTVDYNPCFQTPACLGKNFLGNDA